MTDSVPLVDFLTAKIDAQGRRFDDLRSADEHARQEHHLLERLALNIAMVAQQDAIEKAQTALERRLDEAKAALEVRLSESRTALEHRLDGLNRLREDVATKAQLEVLENRLADLGSRYERFEARNEGRARGLRDYVGWIVAVVVVISGVITMLAHR